MILQDGPSINAALATMNPIAREATQLLTHRIMENTSLLDNETALEREAIEACLISLARAGIKLPEQHDRVTAFIEDHGQNVLNLSVSVIVFLARDAKKKKVRGAVGKVAAVAGAVALGAIFG